MLPGQSFKDSAVNSVDVEHQNVVIALPVDVLVLDMTHLSTGNLENALLISCYNIESIKTTSMKDVSTRVLEKIKNI